MLFISSLNVIRVSLIQLGSKQYRIVPYSLHAAALRTRRCNAEKLQPSHLGYNVVLPSVSVIKVKVLDASKSASVSTEGCAYNSVACHVGKPDVPSSLQWGLWYQDTVMYLSFLL